MHKFALGSVSPFVRTPNLDALAARGTRFDRCYSNHPVCTPYRGILLTGQLSCDCGVTGNDDPLPTNIPTLADAFNAAGYETAFVGKWHLGGNGNTPIPKNLRGGFKHFTGYQCYNGFYRDVCFYDEDDREHRFENEHREDVCTRLAIDRMKKMRATGRPFLEVVSFQAPHYPEQPPPEFAALYENATIPVPPDYIETEPYTPTYSPPSPRPFELCPDYQRYGGDMQEYLRLYYAMVTHIDACVGKILAALDGLGIREETNIFFSSDHGDMQGSRGMVNKQLPYERSCGIPFIACVPGGAKGLTTALPVSAVDVYPSLLSLHGLPREKHLQGFDFTPALFGKPVSAPPVFCENISPVPLSRGAEHHPWKMVFDGRHKLVMNWKTKTPCLLFDMDTDPWEQNNLVGKLPSVETPLANLILSRFKNS